MLRVRQFRAVACLAFFETLRQPILLLLTGACVGLIALLPLVQMHQFGEEGKLVRDSALALHFVFGLLVAAYSSSSTLAREMRSGTVSVVLSKPIGRELFFLAKYCGTLAVVVFFSACTTLATLLSERVAEKFVSTEHTLSYVTDWRTGSLLLVAPFVACLVAAALNWATDRPFSSTALILLFGYIVGLFFTAGLFERDGTYAPFDLRVEWRILPVSLLVTLGLAVLSAIALALSTRFSTVPTLSLLSGIFLLGLLSDYLFGGRVWTAWLYGLLPNGQNFWLADALTAEGRVPWSYVARAAGYAAAYTVAALSSGLVCFRHADV
ncbi:MAG: ABC transporter permease subunit [Kiritimatiellia bacterium]